jgi:menaquinone-dependent protoporphyrinogen oxidase
MRILVVHGSKRGGTAGLADMIGAALTGLGHDVSVAAARSVGTLPETDAVIVAGGIYAGRWHGDARSFVKHHQAALKALPVWLVGSGPLDDTAEQGTFQLGSAVLELAEKIGARGTQAFGGYLSADAKGFPASSMAKTHAGDWRDPEHVQRWAREVDAALAA